MSDVFWYASCYCDILIEVIQTREGVWKIQEKGTPSFARIGTIDFVL